MTAAIESREWHSVHFAYFLLAMLRCARSLARPSLWLAQ